MSGTTTFQYPPCSLIDLGMGCNDQGKDPDGTSCDCDKASILGFEGWGLSHRQAVLINATLGRYENGYSDELPTEVQKLWNIMDNTAIDDLKEPLTKWYTDHEEFAQQATAEFGHLQYA